MNPKEELEKYKKVFDVELKNYLTSKEEEYKNISPFISEIFQNISEFTLRGGKRLRPALLFHAYKLFGGDNENEVVKLSVFMELLQSYLLIHDDIFDHADTRRNGPAFHKIYENICSKKGWEDNEHFGTTMGVLGGDIASQLVFDIITKSNFPDDRKNKLINIVAKLTNDVLIGQVEDFILSFNMNYQPEDIEKIYFYKTATYTFDMPLISGSILAGKNENDSDVIALREYAKFAGMAFQLRDDILGVFGNEELTGKPAISDIKEGKKTMLVLNAEKKANINQGAMLRNALGNKNLTDKEAEDFRKVVIETGSLEDSKKKCEEYIEKAKEALNKIHLKNDSTNFLTALANYLIVRDI